MTDPVQKWALLWRSKNCLDGERKHLVFENGIPVLFRTRNDARKFASERYGYIKHRPDLRAEPHGWRFPQPIKVQVSL